MPAMQRAAEVAARIYEGIPGSLLQKWRPAICPFDLLIAQVPPQSTVLDVGCGSGLFLGLLAAAGRIRSGLGFDSSAPAIARADCMRRRLPEPARLAFVHRDAAAAWPDGDFDVVCLIDVMHHVQPAQQRPLIETAIAKLRPGGTLVYKDMVRRPAWRAWMNRLHDLLLARQWIHYAPIDQVASWIRGAGLEIVHEPRCSMLWYGHEILVARAAAPGASRPPA